MKRKVIVLLLCFCGAASAQPSELLNAGFDMPSPEQQPAPYHWDTRLNGADIALDHNQPFAGSISVRVSAIQPGGLAIVHQTIEAHSLRGKAIEISVNYRTDEMERTMGGIALLTSRPDQEILRIFSGDYLEGSPEWASKKLRTVIHPQAQNIRIELIAWFKSSDTQPLTPDVLVPNADRTPDTTLETAVNWLHEQPACEQ